MIPLLNTEDCLQAWQKLSYPAQKNYLAFYSSILGGITTDPAFMTVPVDDHLVHRGDGVFEALKSKDRGLYLWQAHRDRLSVSAKAIGLRIPENLEEAVAETVKAADSKNCIIRIFLARGPGQFTTNPYDSIGEQLYIAVTHSSRLPEIKYTKGARIGRSQIPPKESWLARLKTCNYLPNVMMKKEAVDRNIDFTIGFDSTGFVTEGSTENLVILTKKGELIRPRLQQILRGTTMSRAFDLAAGLQSQGLIRSIGERDISEADLKQAEEVMMVGTTLDVLPVTEYEGLPVGTGEVGPVAQALLGLLIEDQASGDVVWRV